MFVGNFFEPEAMNHENRKEKKVDPPPVFRSKIPLIP